MSFLLAAATLPDDPNNTIITFGLVAFVVFLAAAVVSIWHMTRPNPPVKKLIEVEVEKAEGRLKEQITTLGKKIDNVSNPNPPIKELVESEVGKVEGRLEKRLDNLAKKIDQVSDEQSDKRYKIYRRIETETKDLYGRIEAEQRDTREMIEKLSNTVSKSFQDIQRDIGRIETRPNNPPNQP